MRSAVAQLVSAARAARVCALILAGLAIGGATGCASIDSILSSVGSVVEAGTTRLSNRHAYDEPIHLVVAGPMAVDVETFGGDVTVIADPALDRAIITVNRRAIHGFGRTTYAAESLAEITYEADVVPGEIGPTLRFRAQTTHPEAYYQRADVRIELPEVYNVRIMTHNGNVLARNISGQVDISTDDGYVRVLTEREMRRPVTIVNHSGDIDYRVRGESSGVLDFEAVRGIVTHHVDFGELIVHAGTDQDTLRALFNGGPNPVILRAADGDIRFAVVDAPTRIGAFVVD